jgi:AcrR family transcriptional regulator
MTIAERRSREREQLRTRILEAARDLLSAQGLHALSMRSIAERIEYSPATLYLYFKDKDELVREVVKTGFERMREVVSRELRALPETANAAQQYGAMGRAYARFALENPAYFRVMFELPGTAEVECPTELGGKDGFRDVVETVQRGVEQGLIGTDDACRTAVIGWGLVHGLTSLYLSGHLAGQVVSHEGFLELVEEAMRTMDTGFRPARH